MQDRSDIVGSILDLAPGAWNASVGGAVGLHYGLLRTLEETTRRTRPRRYFVLLAGGKYRAVAAGYLVRNRGEANGLNAPVFGRFEHILRRAGIGFQPAMICGTAMCSDAGLSVAGDTCSDERVALTHELCAAIERHAAEQRIAVGFVGVPESNVTLRAVLHERGYASTLTHPVTYCDIAWDSAEGYLASLRAMSKSAYQTARHEINRYRKCDGRIRRAAEAGTTQTELYQLLYNHNLRKNVVPPAFGEHFLPRLTENMATDAVIYVAEKKSDITGVTVLLRKGDNAHMPLVGIDHERAGNNFTYFNLAFYAPVMEGAQMGLRRIGYGNAVYEAKIRRGCRVQRSYLYYRSASDVRQQAVRALFAAHRRWYKHKFNRYVAPKRVCAARTKPVRGQ